MSATVPQSTSAGPVTANAATLCEAFQATAAAHADLVALRTADGATEITYGEYAQRVRSLAAGLAAVGVKRGDTLALLMSNRPEFNLLDTAAIHLGATPFSIYATLAPEQISYLFANAANTVAVIEEAFLERVLAARGDAAEPSTIVVIDGAPSADTITLEELEAGGDPAFDFEAAWGAVQPSDVATLIYTSGTTGPPKGVELTHANLLAQCRAVAEVLSIEPGDTITSYLPAAHIADRWSTHYNAIMFGIQVTCVPDPRAVAAALPGLRPTVWGAVPRVAEKLKAALEVGLQNDPDEARREAVLGAIALARQKVALEQAGEPVPPELAEKVAQLDAAVLSKLREKIGLDRVKWFIVGAAPLSREVHEFLLALGLPMTEIWGMSECSCCVTVTAPERAKIGSVGQAISCVELRLADDGEMLVRGETIMRGYRGEPEKTAETIDSDGWLHTGDICTIDDEGFVRIIDRKKELIINAAGKNMSPANIEQELKSADPLIGQAAVIGDARPYNVALLVLDPDVAAGADAADEADPGARRRRGREGERAALAGGADQALGAAGRRVAARRRRADADDEAQAQADRGEVRRRHRRAVRLSRMTEQLVAEGHVLVDLADGVAHVRFNRPEASNGLHVPFLRSLYDALLLVHGDPRTRAVLLSGEGKHFCAGGDVVTFAEQGEALPDYLREATTWLANCTTALLALRAPVVAAVHGYAAGGGGFGMVCASDLVIAGESAKFMLGATRVGMAPDAGGSVTLTQLVGLRKAMEIALLNPVLSAEEALSLGLITRVVPDDSVLSEARVAGSVAGGRTDAGAGGDQAAAVGWRRRLGFGAAERRVAGRVRAVGNGRRARGARGRDREARAAVHGPMSDLVIVTRTGAVLQLELNRPEALNAWIPELGEQLLAAVRSAGADPDIRAVLICGAGRAFSAGADVKAPRNLTAAGEPDLSSRLQEIYNPLILELRRLPKPVVAAVQGAAAGIGASLALACDLIVAAESSYLLLAFVNIALSPDGGALPHIVARAGPARAAQLAMLGERLPAREALAWGLVNEVVADEDLRPRALELAQRLARAPTVAIGSIKELLNAASGVDLERLLAFEASLQQRHASTADHAEGIAAFKEKRRPEFEGR